MKRFQAEYSENSIVYWPYSEAGIIGLILITVISTLVVATAIWTLLDNLSRETRMETQVALPIVVFVSCVLIRFLYRRMHMKFVITNKGIEYFEYNDAAGKQIAWENVEAVYFSQGLHGERSCRIFFKKPASQRPREKDKCDFGLPVACVDVQKLVQLIPKSLWGNIPWYKWY